MQIDLSTDLKTLENKQCFEKLLGQKLRQRKIDEVNELQITFILWAY